MGSHCVFEKAGSLILCPVTVTCLFLQRVLLVIRCPKTLQSLWLYSCREVDLGLLFPIVRFSSLAPFRTCIGLYA